MSGFWLWFGLASGLVYAEPRFESESAEVQLEVPEPTLQGIPVSLIEEAIAVRSLSLDQRLDRVSKLLLQRPYKVDAIGEGKAPDSDPIFRYDVFDCLTFVEEVLALTLPYDPLDAPKIRQRLRYGSDGGIDYDNRNHFMLQQWIPNGIESGILEDVTSDLGASVLMEKTVSKNTWMRWKSRSRFHLSDEQFPVGEYQLDILPTDEAMAVLHDIPKGALILTVRENRSYVPIVVTHIGFVVPSADPDRPMIRHATKMGAQPRVRNDFLDWYLEHLSNYKYWKVAGIVVLLPQEIEPR